MGEDPQRSRDAVERSARACDVLATIRRSWAAYGSPTLFKGHAGQPVRHPLVVAIEAQENHVAALGEALLLTPASRSRAQRAGWRKGSARAPDRHAQPLRLARPTD